jgi:hypothetical protein
MKKSLLIIAILICRPFFGRSQERDTRRMPDHLNVIGFNPAPMLV